jgi:hypothetical protein
MKREEAMKRKKGRTTISAENQDGGPPFSDRGGPAEIEQEEM